MSRMNRREFVGATALAALATAGAAKRTMPNLLVLFSDDQRFDTIGALGNPDIITPNLDRLVREGTAFTHAHTMGAMTGAPCIPSRAMLLTGRTLFHLEGQGNTIPVSHTTLPEWLNGHGYATFHTGKWHNDKASHARCFQHAQAAFFGGMTNQWEVPVYDLDPSGAYPKESERIEKTYSTTLFTDSLIRFLDTRDKSRPYFAYAAFTVPHDPRVAPPQYAAMYSPEKIPLPPNFMPEHPFDNGDMQLRDEKLAPWPRTQEYVKEQTAAYYAMITHLDAEIGRVLDYLDRQGLAENTIVLFAGDNGLALGRHGLLGKQNLYDHSVRVPLIMRGPSIPADVRLDDCCYLLDVFPTLADVLGLEPPETVEGVSFHPRFQGKKKVLRDSIFTAYREVQRAVRKEDWKLITYHVQGKNTVQLFDVGSDPWETRNLADDVSHANRRKELMGLILASQQRLNDPNARLWAENYVDA